MTTNAAYDLRTFTTTPVVKVVKPRKPQKKSKFNLKSVVGLYFVILIALMSVTVYNQAVLTETRAQVNSSRSQLSTLENTYETLNAKLDNMVSIQAAETYAVNVLGMVKLDSSQIVYVNLESENIIVAGEVSSTPLQTLKTALASVTDFFGLG